MSSKPSTFKPAAPNIWKRLSEELGGDFADEAGWRQDKVVAQDGDWTVTLDIHSEPHYRHEAIFTRFRAPYMNPDGFRFNIYHQSVASKLARLLGMQDIQIGYPEFDRVFVIKSGDPERIKQLLADERLRTLMAAEPEMHMHVRDSNDWFSERFPAGVDELVLEVEGRVKKYDRLTALYELFTEMLHALTHRSEAYDQQ